MLNDMIYGKKLNINEPKLLNSPDIFKISDSAYISIALYKKRGNQFYDVIFVNNGKEFFLGRYAREEKPIKVNYNNGKILVYMEEFNRECEKMVVTKVFSLYDILDDITYAYTEEEALKLFDGSIDTKYLKNKDNTIVRNDIEKRKRLK